MSLAPGASVAARAVRSSPLRELLLREGMQLALVEDVEVWVGEAGVGTLADLSSCDRLGLKGRGTAAWLKAQGVLPPPEPNRLVEREDGLVVARLADAEFALADFSRARSPALQALRQAYAQDAPAGCYDVPRAESQAAFGLAGPPAWAALAALCPADLRPRVFGPGTLLQTLSAGAAAQLWHLAPREGQPGSRLVLLADATLSHHHWEALHTAVTAAAGEVGVQSAWLDAPAASLLQP